MSVSQEIEDLKREIENFKAEKERVRAIIGQIGGMPTSHAAFWNVLFIIFVFVCFTLSVINKGHISALMTDLGIAAISVKLILLMHYQNKVNHFQLWILSSMEWKLNEITKKVNRLMKR